MINERRQDEVSDYRILVGLEDCHIDRARRKCTVIDGAISAIDEFFAEFEGMAEEQRKRGFLEDGDFYARLFYTDGLLRDLMLRKHVQEIDGVRHDAINVARVCVRHEHQKGNGTLKVVLDHIEKRADERGWLVMCESTRGSLASHLAKRGYIPFTAQNSCQGFVKGFSNTWARLPSLRAAIVNLPTEILALLGISLHARASDMMQEIMIEEMQRMLTSVRERHAREVRPVFEEEDRELKLRAAKRSTVLKSTN